MALGSRGAIREMVDKPPMVRRRRARKINLAINLCIIPLCMISNGVRQTEKIAAQIWAKCKLQLGKKAIILALEGELG